VGVKLLSVKHRTSYFLLKTSHVVHIKPAVYRSKYERF